MVESAVVLPICLLLLLGMLELSIALVRHTVMSEAARRVARAAIVHGSKATSSSGRWGPAPLQTSADSSEPSAAAVRDVLMTLDPADVSIAVNWPDGGNQPDQRVQVTVRYTHHPMISFPGLYGQLDLIGVSTMRIAH
jgi:Flp pilus assembly protein TadG